MATYTPISFAPIVYPDWGDLFDSLPDEQCAQLLKAIARYPEYEPPQGNIAWKFIKGQLDKQYQKFLERTQKAKASRQCGATNVDERRLTSTVGDERQQNLTEVDHKPIPKPIPQPKLKLESEKDIYPHPISESASSSASEEPRRADKKKASVIQKPEDVAQEDWTAFLKLRKDKKMPLTQRALDLMRSEGKKANLSMQQVIVKCLEESWAGFKAAWLENKPIEKHEEPSIHKVKNPGPPPSKDDDGWKAQEAYFRRIGMFKGLAS